MMNEPGSVFPEGVRHGGHLVEWDFDEGTACARVPGGARVGPPEALAAHLAAWKAAIHPDDVERVERAIDEHRSGRLPAFLADYRLSAGAGRWMEVTDLGVAVARGSDGLPRKLVVARSTVAPDEIGGPGIRRETVRYFGHQLNNQLAVLQAYLVILLQDLGRDEPIRKDLQEMHATTAEAAKTIAELMAAAR